MQLAVKRKLLITASIIISIVTVVGVMGFFGGMLIGIGAIDVKKSTELPLGMIEDIAVDGGGRIYVASNFYNRLQVYDSSGRFLRGWLIDTHGKHVHLGATGEDTIEVVMWWENQVHSYNSEGALLSDRRSEDHRYFLSTGTTYNHFWRSARDRQCNTYVARLAGVTKIDKSGTKTRVVSTPLYLWLITAPLPVFLYFFVGLFLLQACWSTLGMFPGSVLEKFYRDIFRYHPPS